MPIATIAPVTDSEIAIALELFVEYAASLDFSLAYQDFATELAGLPGAYAAPSGALLLARIAGASCGVVAMRRHAGDICEMKRLYVRPEHRGRDANAPSIGRQLATAIIDEARRRGYRSMRLDTIDTMTAAIALYRSMGFREIAPYYASPLPNTVFMELVW